MLLPKTWPLLLGVALLGCETPPADGPQPGPEPRPQAAAETTLNATLIDEPNALPAGMNDGFTAAGAVDEFVERFERESREVFANRTKIARAVGLTEGMCVADIGAGTGLFTRMFAQDVGPTGKVYAVDISEKFIDHLNAQVTQRSLTQVQPVLCTAKSAELPVDSVDAVFICDTYHHFEFPRNTMASIHRALRPGGTVVLVDFERIEGVSREWILEHMRAGREVFIEEITDAGFELIGEEQIEGLEENYCLRFRKK